MLVAQPGRATTTHNFEAVHTFVYEVQLLLFASRHHIEPPVASVNEELKRHSVGESCLLGCYISKSSFNNYLFSLMNVQRS